MIEIDSNLKTLMLISRTIEAIRALRGVSIVDVPINGEEMWKDDLQKETQSQASFPSKSSFTFG